MDADEGERRRIHWEVPVSLFAGAVIVREGKKERMGNKKKVGGLYMNSLLAGA